MQRRMDADKPALIMLSHCVPAEGGDAARARAWQLLNWLSQSHTVDLACVCDGPVHLSHWRALQSATRQLNIEPMGLVRGARRAALAPMGRTAAQALAARSALRRGIEPWLERRRYEVAACTSALLWPTAGKAPVAQRLCDVHVPTDGAHDDTTLPSLTLRLPQRCEGRTIRRWVRRAANDCDLLIMSNPLHAGWVMDKPCETLVLPTHAIEAATAAETLAAHLHARRAAPSAPPKRRAA